MLIAAAAVTIGLVIGAIPTALNPVYPEVVRGCRVLDGDTLACLGERIRLLGIDAPEHGACPPGRRCAAGDPIAATSALRGAINGFSMRAARFETDRHGRTVAAVRGPFGDLSCGQVRGGHAAYRSDWDRNLRVARTCLGERYRSFDP